MKSMSFLRRLATYAAGLSAILLLTACERQTESSIQPGSRARGFMAVNQSFMSDLKNFIILLDEEELTRLSSQL